MEKFDFKKFIPYLIAIVAFVLISLLYFYPLLEGKVLKQGDIVLLRLTGHESNRHRHSFAPIG